MSLVGSSARGGGVGKGLRRLVACSGAVLLAACANQSAPPTTPPPTTQPSREAFVDTLEERTFRFFWDTANPANGLVPDRWPDPPFSSVAAVGFGLGAYPVGVERGYVTRDEARARTLATLRFLWNAPQGPGATGVAGYRGFYYHFLDMNTGLRFKTVELSTIDTALLMAGVLTVQEYFDQDQPQEREIRSLADSLYRRVDWAWMQDPSGLVSMGWNPENGRLTSAYEGYDEAMILYLLALGSPTHPVEATAWPAFTSTYPWKEFYGQTHVNFAPLFGHQYSQIWVDFRGIQDAFMRGKGIDYFENSRRATLAQQSYAADNPGGWVGYGANVWGLTASDGPVGATLVVDGRSRTFHTYWARGADATAIRDDGTIAPTAAGGSVAFAPDIALEALQTMRRSYGDNLFGQYGFYDAFNPTLRGNEQVSAGHIVPGVGWFDDQYLGIDQGPIVLMLENYRSGLIWDLLRTNPYIVRGLCRAGFTGGWIEGRCG
ncbi:MAG TPA: glucoamylase family protein [Longimicrobiaceae bacterium]|nr:glucoamylase family protein [Longimicrobiaceae bacterium]